MLVTDIGTLSFSLSLVLSLSFSSLTLSLPLFLSSFLLSLPPSFLSWQYWGLNSGLELASLILYHADIIFLSK
jgi:hypothetical protein